MKTYLIIFSLIYLFIMLFFTFRYIKDKNIVKNSDSFLFANSNVGVVLTFLGILATLFSTFTLQGMPSFFRNHGIGAWIFLGITDVALGGLMLYFGLKFRTLASSFAGNPKNITEFLKEAGYSKYTIFFYLLFTTIFLIPYITIQIKGAAFLFQNVFPVGESYLFWSCVMVILMLLYSSFGGIRAIYITDAFQGIVILFTTWAIAYFVLKNIGGIETLFLHVKETNEALLSIPGPKGVLNWQFLVISFISIVLMPYVQPQLTTRMLVTKDDKSFIRASLVFSFFVILVILPTLFIGLRGSLIKEQNFILYILQNDIPPIFYALFIIGIVSASMSTSDSQLMAIGTEWSSFFSKKKIEKNKNAKIYVKITAILTAIIALILAQNPFKSLVLFAINSFIGTSFLTPIIYSLSKESKVIKKVLIGTSFICIFIFISVLVGILPKSISDFRVELFLYLFMEVVILFSHKFSR